MSDDRRAVLEDRREAVGRREASRGRNGQELQDLMER